MIVPARLGARHVRDDPWPRNDSRPHVRECVVEGNRIEGNRIHGGRGCGIALNRASRNRILDNTITGITLGDPSVFEEANGAGLWVSPGSDENEIVGNTFDDITTHAIVLEGDRNVVRTRGGSEAVRDLGNGNRVTGSDSR